MENPNDRIPCKEGEAKTDEQRVRSLYPEAFARNHASRGIGEPQHWVIYDKRDPEERMPISIQTSSCERKAWVDASLRLPAPLPAEDVEASEFRGLEALVSAARSWHDFHHGSVCVQCDEICDTLPDAEKDLAQLRTFVAQASELRRERDEAVQQLSMLPGFILGQTMLVPIGSIAELNAMRNRCERAETRIAEFEAKLKEAGDGE